VEELKNKSDFQAAKGGEFFIVEGVKGMTFEVDLTGGRGIEGAEKMEESTFATTARTGDGDDFPWEDFESDPAECIHPSFTSLIRFVEITGFEHGKSGFRICG